MEESTPYQFRLLTDGAPRLAPGRSGCSRASPPSFASTRSNLQARTPGGTDSRNSSSAPSAGSTSMVLGPRCRSRPTATSARPAPSGTSKGTASPHHKQYVEAPKQSGSTTSAPSRPGAWSSRSPGSWPPQLRRRRWQYSPQTSPGMLITASVDGATTSTPTSCPHAHRQFATGAAAVHRSRKRHLRHRHLRPLSFERPEAINHIAATENIEDPIEGRAGLPPGPRRVAAPRLARKAPVRLRLLRRDPARLGRPRRWTPTKF